MSDTRLLLEITPKGILSFGDETAPIQLSSLNVLIGTNGSGKSNLIDVIGLIRATTRDLGGEIIENGGIGDWRWKGNDSLKSCSVSLSAKSKKINLWFHEMILFEQKSGIPILSENIIDSKNDELVYSNDLFSMQILSSDKKFTYLNEKQFTNEQSIISQLKDPVRYNLISHMFEAYS